ncbi:unnamed protein product, partial [Symbiodinium microadriaticum]
VKASPGMRLSSDVAGELSSEFLKTQRPLLDLVARLRPQLSQDPLRHPFDVGI